MILKVYILVQEFLPSPLCAILPNKNNSPLRGGKTSFLDFISSQGHPQQKDGKSQEDSGMGRFDKRQKTVGGRGFQPPYRVKNGQKILDLQKVGK